MTRQYNSGDNVANANQSPIELLEGFEGLSDKFILLRISANN